MIDGQAGTPADTRPFLLAMGVSAVVAFGMAKIGDAALNDNALIGHVAVSLFLCSVTILVRRRVRSSGVAVLTALLLVPLLGAILSGRLFWATAFITLILAVVVERRQWRLADGLPLLAAAAAIGAIVLSEADTPYANFMVETRLLSADIHTDSAFHMALSNMVMGERTVSMGLHGAPPAGYHAFSHFMYGSIAGLLALPVSSTYGLATLIVFVPFLFATLLAFAGELRPDGARWSLYASVLLLIGFLVGFAGRPAMENCTLWHSYFVSESYLLGLVLFIAFLSYQIGGGWSLPIVVLFLLLLTATKASLGSIAGIVLVVSAWRAWRRHAQTLTHLALVVGTAGVLSVATLVLFLPEGNAGRLQFLTFVDSYMTASCSLAGATFVSRIAAFLVAHYAFLWVAVAGWLLARRSRPSVLETDVMVAAMVAAVVGFIPLSMAIPGGGAFYFSNVATFAAMPLFLTLGANVTEPAGTRARLFAVTILIAAGAGALVYGVPFVAERLERLAAMKYPTTAPVTPYIRHLQAIRDAAPQRALVYIAKEERDYWDAQPVDCTRMSLLIPAVSSYPALYGVPERKCRERVERVFPRYEPVFDAASRLRIPEAELCAETRRLGYETYVDVRQSGIRHVACALTS